MFIVFEGIDGSGSSTQARLLAQNLKKQDYDIRLTAEPTDGEIGKLVRRRLRREFNCTPEALQLLFCADRIDHLLTDVFHHSHYRRRIVIQERYFYSTLAFGMVQIEQSEWLKAVCSIFPAPDLIFYSEISPEEAIKRIGARGNKEELFENLPTLKQVIKNYEQVFREQQTADILVKLNAKESIENLSEQVLAETLDRYHRSR
jgi:dTMP kinase